MDENNRNFILAMLLSLVVLVTWQVFYAGPKMQEQKARQEAAERISKKTAGENVPRPDGAGVPRPDATTPTAPGGPVSIPTPSGPAAAAEARQAVLATVPRVRIDTPSLKGSVSLRGVRIDDLILKDYREKAEPDSPNIVLLSPSDSAKPYYAEHGWVAGGGARLKLPTATSVWKREGSGALTVKRPVTFVFDNGEGLIFRRTISLDRNYMFTIRQGVENKSGKSIVLHPYALVSRQYTPETQSFYILHEGMIGVAGKNGLQEIDYEDVLEGKPVSLENNVGGWLGITDKYWATTVIPDQKTGFQARFSGEQRGTRPSYQADYLSNGVTVAPGGRATVTGYLFAGAKRVGVINAYAENLKIDRFDLMIDWGWFKFLTKPLFSALDFFYKLIGNFGLSILIVTVIIKLILFPLANKSYVSMSRMKKLQPEMMKIKERYENDKARQQQALMDMYKKEKVNPASGCLPILVQIPVFFALYKVLFITIEMRHAPFYGWIKDLSAPDPTTLFNLFGLIPWDPPSFLMVGIWPIIMGITMFVQMRLNPAPPDPVQAQIFTWMPLIFTFLLATFPAGLVIYWAWNNLLSIIQQWTIMARQGVEVALFDNLGFKGKSAGDSGKS